ncbi:unnamed protein product [Effrenium voratum]|uniref:Uncharacterized protein n=1 Tax=Effrenium voratum TaxID=2562239 RepID=A0AA36ICT5_9DINO|nr:unnamed protein product [Effrenium voratum]
MAHPFYWTAQTGLRFLVTLGNYKEAPFANVLLSKVRQAIQEALVNDERTWFDVVMDLEQSGIHATDDRLKGQPFGLLKFIRNKCIHLNSGMPWSLRQKLLNQRIFQESASPRWSHCAGRPY